MRSSILVLISLILFSCNNEKVNNLSTDEGIEGKVKFISESDFEAKEKFGELAKDSLLFKITYSYDESGNEIEESSFDSKGSLLSKMSFEYDEAGNPIESNRFNSDGSLAHKFIFKYNDQGKVRERSAYDSTLDNKCIFKYNEAGKVIEKYNYYSDGTLDDKMIYKYKNQDKEVEINCYNSIDSVISRTVSKYDENGKEIESNFYNPGGNTIWLTSSNKYNADGLLVENIYFEIERKKSVSKYIYKFDKKGNWIEKSKYVDNKPSQITVREIEYY